MPPSKGAVPDFDAGKWKEASRRYRRLMGMALERKPSNLKFADGHEVRLRDSLNGSQSSQIVQTSKKSNSLSGMNEAEYVAAVEEGRATEDRPHDHPHLPDLKMAKMLRCWVRCLAADLIYRRPISASLRFTDGVVIGSKGFVDDAFEAARERFSERRKDGARRMRGSGKAAAGILWSARDLRVGIG